MKEIEITVRVLDSFEEAVAKLEKLGFKKIRTSIIDDIYMTTKMSELNKDNIQQILKKSLLLRRVIFEDEEIMKITYKNKELDKNGDVISEQKENLNIENIEQAKKVLECVDFEELVKVKYDLVVYEKDGVELAFQIVDNLGTFIEFESEKDFDGKTLEEINEEKEKMYNYIKETGIKITEEKDIKKAYELIEKKL